MQVGADRKGRGMEFRYDRTADSIFVWLAKEKVAETKEIGPGVYADYDAEGRLIAVEAFKASERYDLSGVEGAVPLEVKPPDVPKIAEMTPAERKELVAKLMRSSEKHSRDMGPRTWTRDDLYDRPKRYYQ